MFVKNRTAYEVALPRTPLSGAMGLAALVVTWRVPLGFPADVPPTSKTWPPPIARYASFRGVSVTAEGTVWGPPRPPFVADVQLAVAARALTLRVFGPRLFVGPRGALRPSAPEPFEAVALDWTETFGGGVVPGTAPHALNPRGRGHYASEEQAQGAPLAPVERAAEPVRAWTDRPRPAGVAPCADLPGLRLDAPDAGLRDGPNLRALSALALRLAHSAPGELVFDDVAAGTPVRLSGVGLANYTFAVPRAPIRVWVRGRRSLEIEPRLRALHVDANGGVLHGMHGFPFRYASTTPPRDVVVEPAAPSWERP